jgi:hypothetical protein
MRAVCAKQHRSGFRVWGGYESGVFGASASENFSVVLQRSNLVTGCPAIGRMSGFWRTV